MKLTSDSETLAENRALILYILDKIAKPITNNALFQLVIAIQDINYFYFQQFLLDLLDNQYIIKYTKEEETLYEMTSLGKETLELTNDIIPGIIKLKIDSHIKEDLEMIEDEQSIVAEYIPESETDYTVKCKITENNKTIFELKLFAGSREQAKKLADNWEKNALKLYPKILKLVSEEKTKKN